jgi:hypothetical protein
MVSLSSYHFRRMFCGSWSRADDDFHFVLVMRLVLDFEVELRLSMRRIFEAPVSVVGARSPCLMMKMLSDSLPS